MENRSPASSSSPSPLNEMDRHAEHECPEEAAARSPNSPGAVLDEEPIARLVIQEDHWGPDHRCLAPSAVPTRDLLKAEREGLSVGRLDHLTRGELNQIVSGYKARNPGNELRGCGVAQASRVRGLRTDGLRDFCIVDDPRDGINSHALVRLANRAEHNQASVRKLRKSLIELFAPHSAEWLCSLTEAPS